MDNYQTLSAKAQLLLSKHPKLQQITGDKLVMEPPDMVAVLSAKTPLPDGDYIKVNAATPPAAAEFDWTIEFTTTTEHYLLLKTGQIVRAVRKDFFPTKPHEIKALDQMLDAALATLG